MARSRAQLYIAPAPDPAAHEAALRCLLRFTPVAARQLEPLGLSWTPAHPAPLLAPTSALALAVAAVAAPAPAKGAATSAPRAHGGEIARGLATTRRRRSVDEPSLLQSSAPY